MFYACATRFHMTGNFENFLVFRVNLEALVCKSNYGWYLAAGTTTYATRCVSVVRPLLQAGTGLLLYIRPQKGHQRHAACIAVGN